MCTTCIRLKRAQFSVFSRSSSETDACLSSTSFASKLDPDTLKDELINRISDLRHEMLKIGDKSLT